MGKTRIHSRGSKTYLKFCFQCYPLLSLFDSLSLYQLKVNVNT
nr:MAG TPA: hypothetical protein [Caudoviricetes sp.]